MEYLIKPVPKPRRKPSDTRNNPQCVKDYLKFKHAVQEDNIQIPVPCKITFYMSMPKSWSIRKRSEMNNTPHTKNPDKNSLEKALMHALEEDFCGVWSGWVEKRWRNHVGIKIEEL